MRDHPALLQALSSISRDLCVPDPCRGSLADVAGSVANALGASGSTLSLVDGPDVRCVAASDDPSADLHDRQEALREGPSPEARRSGRPVHVRDQTEATERWPGLADVARTVGVAAMAAVPVVRENRTVAVLGLYHREAREWGGDDVTLAGALGDVMTSLVTSGAELRRLREINQQLNLALSSRVLIEQAKGVVATQRNVPPDQAFELIRGHARTNQLSVRVVAQRIIRTGLRL